MKTVAPICPRLPCSREEAKPLYNSCTSENKNLPSLFEQEHYVDPTSFPAARLLMRPAKHSHTLRNVKMPLYFYPACFVEFHYSGADALRFPYCLESGLHLCVVAKFLANMWGQVALVLGEPEYPKRVGLLPTS
jgi:hypothetical protein